jgi:anti-anti-sigma regulatory factor
MNSVAPEPGAQAAGSGAADTCEMALDASLEIGEVSEMRRRFLDALVGIRRMSLDVRPLTTVDTAGVQLLLALAQETKRRGIALSCQGDSPVLTLALRSLGFAGFL